MAPVALPHWDGERLSVTFSYCQALAGAGLLLRTVFTEVRLMQLARSDGRRAEGAALFAVLRCSLNDTEPLGARAVGFRFHSHTPSSCPNARLEVAGQELQSSLVARKGGLGKTDDG